MTVPTTEDLESTYKKFQRVRDLGERQDGR